MRHNKLGNEKVRWSINKHENTKISICHCFFYVPLLLMLVFETKAAFTLGTQNGQTSTEYFIENGKNL